MLSVVTGILATGMQENADVTPVLPEAFSMMVSAM